jgi:hypothetical protein
VRVLQSIIQLLSLEMHGVYQSEAMLINGQTPSVTCGGWPVDSASGYQMILRWVEGTTDPRNFTFTISTPNPEYIPGLPGEDPYEQQTAGGGLPGRGTLHVSANSPLRHHAGWIVKNFDIPEGFTLGDAFTANLETPIGSAAASLRPGQTGPVTAAYHLYTIGYEPHIHPRDHYSFFGVFRTKYFAAPAAGVLTLEAAERVKKTDSNYAWFKAWSLVNGQWTALSLDSRVKNFHTETGYSSTLDLTDYDTEGITWLKVKYLLESPLAKAICAGQDRCKWSYYDPTGSWGVADSQGRKFYCQNRGALMALGEAGETYLANYKPACYQTTCPLWTEDTIDNPLEALVSQLTHSLPWLAVQLAPALDLWELMRNGTPSLLSLVGPAFFPPQGYHQVRDLSIETGGYGPIKTFTEDGHQVAHQFPGLEFLTHADDGSNPDLADQDTWPDYGVVGNNWARLTDLGSAAASDSNDPHRIDRAMAMATGPDVDMYYGHIGGGNNQSRQRTRTFDLFCPVVAAGSEPAAFCNNAGGYVQRGTWDAEYNEVEPDDPLIEFRTRIHLARLGPGGAVRSATIKSASASGGYVGVRLKNGMVAASSITSPESEFYSVWMQGGTNVALPDWWRVRNYMSAQDFVGPGRARGFIRRGMAVKVADASLPAGSPLKGHKFMVKSARACATGDKDDYRPGSNREAKGAMGPGWHFIQYGANTENLTSVTISISPPATYREFARNNMVGARPHDLAKDTYWAVQGLNTAGAKGLWLFFSRLNSTGVSADEAIDIAVVTTGGSYVSSLNLGDKWASTQHITVATSSAVTAVAGVTVYTSERNADGSFKSYTLSEVANSGAEEWAVWDSTKYYVEDIDGNNATIMLSPEWAMDYVRIEVEHAAYGGTESQYYDAYVGTPHATSLPEGHKATANNTDLLELVDENGAWAAHLAEFGSLEGATLVAYDDPVADPLATNTVAYSDRQSDTQLTSEQYTAWWADGDIWSRVEIPTDNCAVVHATMCDGSPWPLAAELNALRTALERALE